MRYHNSLLLGSLALFSMLGIHVGEDAINKLFNATVLTPGEELATLNLVARVAK